MPVRPLYKTSSIESDWRHRCASFEHFLGNALCEDVMSLDLFVKDNYQEVIELFNHIMELIQLFS